MKEIVIMVGATNPEKGLLTFLKKLFPECTISIVYASTDSAGSQNDLEVSSRDTGKDV